MNDTTTSASMRSGRSGRHLVNIGHLVMGVAFIALTVVWALIVNDVVEGDDIRFLLPAPWALAGLAGLLALITSDRRKHGQREVGWVGEGRAPGDPSGSTTTATMEP